MRDFQERSIVVASHNSGKIREITELLSPFDIIVHSAASLDLPEPEETGVTFIENAVLKAKAATHLSGLPALSDDSGLAVKALGGEPGLYSARWAGINKDFNEAMNKIEKKLHGKSDRSAEFICALALAWPDGHIESFEGRLSGYLVWPPRGLNGFGYDPMFCADGMTLTFGEIAPEKKHAMSHRSIAFNALLTHCFQKTPRKK
jgi:XTP/dITP diphosphohydrolase